MVKNFIQSQTGNPPSAPSSYTHQAKISVALPEEALHVLLGETILLGKGGKQGKVNCN
jgi:hypothetical protein